MSILLMFLLAGFARAESTNSLLSPDFPQQVKINEIVNFHPIANHHFNLKAPQICSGQKALDAKPGAVKCQFSKPGIAKISLKICDDKETFCKDERFQIQVAKGSAHAKVTESAIFAPKTELPAPPGFLQNEPTKAQKQAQREKKLLLIDFYGIWCPPCNMMDELVFDQKSFQETAKNLVKIKMDADSDLSWNWKNHFHVTAYPTLVIATADLQEIGRVVGSRPLVKFNKWISDQTKLRHEPLVKAENLLRQSHDHKSVEMQARLQRVAEWYLNQDQFGKALPYLLQLSSAEAKMKATVAQLKIEKSKGVEATKLIPLYTSLLDNYSDHPAMLEWLSDLVELDKTAAEPYVKHLQKVAASWTQEKLDDEGLDPGTLKEAIADVLDSAGKKQEARSVYLDAAEAYADMARQSSLKIARGPNMERAYCLYKSQMYSEAEKLYDSLIETYPDEFTFHYYYASTLYELKKYESALQQVSQAEDFSYGDNWIRSVILKVKVQMALNQLGPAKATAETALERIVLPKSSQIRTHRYYQNLRALLRDIEQKTKI